MNRAEVVKMLGIIKIAYPEFNKETNPSDTADLWAEMFEKDNAELALAAAKRHIAKNKFPPKIADIKEQCNLPENGTPHPDGGKWYNGQQLLGV